MRLTIRPPSRWSTAPSRSSPRGTGSCSRPARKRANRARRQRARLRRCSRTTPDGARPWSAGMRCDRRRRTTSVGSTPQDHAGRPARRRSARAGPRSHPRVDRRLPSPPVTALSARRGLCRRLLSRQLRLRRAAPGPARSAGPGWRGWAGVRECPLEGVRVDLGRR